MESMLPSRSLTFRVENISSGATAEEIAKHYYVEDQPRIRVGSIVLTVDINVLDIEG